MGEVSNPSRIAKLCRQSAEALRKALSAVSLKKVLRKGPKMNLHNPISRRREGPRGPEAASKSHSGVLPSQQVWAPAGQSSSSYEVRVRSPAPAPVQGGAKWDVTQRVGLRVGLSDVSRTPPTRPASRKFGEVSGAGGAA